MGERVFRGARSPPGERRGSTDAPHPLDVSIRVGCHAPGMSEPVLPPSPIKGREMRWTIAVLPAEAEGWLRAEVSWADANEIIAVAEGLTLADAVAGATAR
jgi:hypothetical protein